MAFNHENPNINYEMGAWDYYINEVKTFNEKLDKYQEEVNQKLADQDADITNLQNQINEQINGLRNEVREFEERINNEVDSINEHTESYVNNYLTENITEILETNPVIETKFEKIGYIDTNETCTYNLDTDVIYEVMTIDYALNMHKGLAVNNATHVSQVPYIGAEVVADVSLTGGGDDPYALDVNKGRVLSDENVISLSASNNVLTVTNNGSNRIRVYIKPIAAL